jgi:branched-chain amino acid transport system substrate-binding protein
MWWVWLPLLLVFSLPARAADVPAVLLGLVVPTAGETGPVAQSMRRAAELAVADWSPRLNRWVELRVKDDLFDPQQAVVTAEQLVEEGVWGVVGHFFSSSSIPASAVYQDAGIPQVTATSTHPRLTAQGLDSVFRVCGRDDQQALSAADFALTRLKARRIALVHDRTEYGRGLAEAFRREVVRRASGRVVVEDSLAQGDQDFGPQVARLKEARPDAIYFGGLFREAAYLVRQLRHAKVQADFLSDDAVLDPEFVKLAGEDAASGTYLTFAPDPKSLDSARPFMRTYEARYGSVGPYVLHTYDAVGVLLHGIQAAKPVDNSRDELRKVVRAIRATPYQGVLGTLRWDTKGDLVTAPYAVYVTKRGGSMQGWFDQVPPPTPAATGSRPKEQ